MLLWLTLMLFPFFPLATSLARSFTSIKTLRGLPFRKPLTVARIPVSFLNDFTDLPVTEASSARSDSSTSSAPSDFDFDRFNDDFTMTTPTTRRQVGGFMAFPIPQTLVKTLAKNLVKNLVYSFTRTNEQENPRTR